MNHLARTVLLALAMTLCAASQTHPDFSGTWLLNPAESNYRANKPNIPDRLVRTIKQNGNRLSYKVESERKGKKSGFEVDLTIGGEGYESDAAGVVSAEWKGLVAGDHDALQPHQRSSVGPDRDLGSIRRRKQGGGRTRIPQQAGDSPNKPGFR
jgi:hypothetical protein